MTGMADDGQVALGQWRWPARLDAVPVARQAVMTMLDGAQARNLALSDIALAVSEGLTNAVLHAYPADRCDGTISVAVELTSDVVIVVIGDDGRGVRPRADSPGLGMGMSIMAAVTDRLVVESGVGGGTVLRLRFRRSAAAV